MAAADGSGPVSSSGSRDYRITQAPLGDIFGPPSIFIIPDYARAFSWPVAQVQTLLEDLKLSSQNGSEQFLGTLTFAHQATAGEPPEVVDGQQRMVVIFMVLSYLHSWAAGAGLNELRACLWRCLCHDQGTSLDGTQWVTYRLNFAHQAIAKFFKDNILNSFMPVVFVEAEMETFHGGSMGAIPMPNKLMWHLYQTASHVKRHLDTILHTPSGPANAERLVVHLLSRCFVVAVLCQGKERGPAIFAHLNSTGIPLSSNDCLKAKLLAKLPPEHHASFLAKWREMEEILGAADIRKFLEYVKQLEEFMGTMPQLHDAYQYFSLKIASVDNSKPIVDGIFSHASVFIQRTKLKRLHELAEHSPGQSSMFEHYSQPIMDGSVHRTGSATISMEDMAYSRPYQYASPGITMNSTVHGGGGGARAALDAAIASVGHDAFASTAPARLEILGANHDIISSLLAQHQGIAADSYGINRSLHGAHGLEGSHHGASLLSAENSHHGQTAAAAALSAAASPQPVNIGGIHHSSSGHFAVNTQGGSASAGDSLACQSPGESSHGVQPAGLSGSGDDPFNWCTQNTNLDEYLKTD